MTIPRVLMAAALLTLGFMIWGIHRDVWQLTQTLEAGSGDLLKTVTGLSTSMVTAHQKLDKAALEQQAENAKLAKLKPTGRVRIDRPRVRPVPHVPPQQLDFWQRTLNSQPPPISGSRNSR